MIGELLVGSMPIGNYDDITLRMIYAMHDCDIIYSDNLPDNIFKLLSVFNIKKDVVVLKSTNTMYADEQQIKDVIGLILSGKKVLLVAGEGNVGIADPGTQFIQACIEKQLPYTVLPGPSAFLTAFVASGIVNGDFFLSCNMNDPKSVIDRFINQNTPLIILIWQNKIKEILESILSNKQITLACDMTMPTELIFHGTATEILKNPKFKLIKENTKIAFVLHDN
jgi:16S rRNA (cytidine1402-2'-O)-methyltransferase